MLLGLQITDATFGVTDIAPALAAMLTGLAKTEAAELVRLTFAFDALADSVNCAVAIGPLGSRLVFRPLARQVYFPGLPAQLRLFEAAVSAGNALTLTAETLAAGYTKVHSTPAALFPPGLNTSGRVTVPPCTPEPLASVNVVCPQHTLPTTTSSIDPTHRTREVDILRSSITTSIRLVVLFSHFKIQIVNKPIHGACSKFWLVIQNILHPVPMFGKNRSLRASKPCISRDVEVLILLSAQEPAAINDFFLHSYSRHPLDLPYFHENATVPWDRSGNRSANSFAGSHPENSDAWLQNNGEFGTLMAAACLPAVA
jgi:hypothetical protein